MGQRVPVAAPGLRREDLPTGEHPRACVADDLVLVMSERDHLLGTGLPVDREPHEVARSADEVTVLFEQQAAVPVLSVAQRRGRLLRGPLATEGRQRLTSCVGVGGY